MKLRERKARRCEACGKPIGLATIVAGDDFPVAPLCLDCGTRRGVEEVFAMIRARRAEAEP
jgi:RNA polymerase-binding transcription factor DksA